MPLEDRQWRRDVTRYKKLWTVSLKLGVVADVVRDIASALWVARSEGYEPYPLTPAELVGIVRGDDFTAGCRLIVLADAAWWTWAHSLHMQRYIEHDAHRAFNRVYGRMRDQTRRAAGAVFEMEVVA
jgi:hypothetical protein